MKVLKLFLLIVPMLVSCAAPARPAPNATSTLASLSVEPTLTEKPPSPATIEGMVSWLMSSDSTRVPITNVNLELNGHSGSNPHYTTKTDADGHYTFANIEPNDYGLGVYLNLPVGKRMCEAPEYVYNHDLGWLHYATALRGDIWYDILFSSEDVRVSPGQTVFVDFVLKCP